MKIGHADAIAFSRIMKSLLTLILSKADGFASSVLSPNNTVPCPGKETTGLIPLTYKSSLFDLVGSKASFVTFLTLPLLNPAGEMYGLMLSADAHNPAMSPFKVRI